ncbi:hypothetical protein CRG98_038394 [Punica granatum]|uniref:Uncharacterized protein n=1 Tax=Punica granatum TaxID=22663 RepID=A0A2I0ICT5_PUNGR|nr:hypothetical protein CRG98_038394 [Punica granatum]
MAPIPNRPGTFDSKSLVDSGLRPPTGDLDPSTEVAGVLYGYRRPRWRGNQIMEKMENSRKTRGHANAGTLTIRCAGLHGAHVQPRIIVIAFTI